MLNTQQRRERGEAAGQPDGHGSLLNPPRKREEPSPEAESRLPRQQGEDKISFPHGFGMGLWVTGGTVEQYPA